SAAGPLKEVARLTEERQKQLNAKLAGAASRPAASQITADALRQQLAAKGRHDLADQLKPGGALHGIVETAQRTLRGPLDQAASHYLSGRGKSALYNSVSTFQG